MISAVLAATATAVLVVMVSTWLVSLVVHDASIVDIFLVAAETGPGRWGVVGPIVMTTLLVRVSGVAMLERTIAKRRAGYADYVEHTNAFVPGLPKRPVAPAADCEPSG